MINKAPQERCRGEEPAMKIFIHGLESSNQGIKAIYFRERFPDMAIPNFTGELSERMDKLKGILEGASGITMVGSSFGGLMATLFAMEDEARVEKLILLAPAINWIDKSGCATKVLSLPAWIFHGTKDEVISISSVEDSAKRYFTNIIFNRVDDDHNLHRTFETIDWQGFLKDGGLYV
jgi:predicted esterase